MIFRKIIIYFFIIFLSSCLTSQHKRGINYSENTTSYYLSSLEDEEIETLKSETDELNIADIQLYLPPVNQSISNIFYSQKNYLYNYYNNLNLNKPRNEDGICGYTAISMLLSYYDNYWNDDIIPNVYEDGQISSIIIDGNDLSNDFESPGVKDIFISRQLYTDSLDEIRDSYFIGYSNGKKQYADDFMISYENAVVEWIDDNILSGSFFGKLLEIAWNQEMIHRKRNNSEDYLEGVGVDYNIVSTILSEYINQCTLSNYISVYSNRVREEIGLTKNIIRNQIINKLSDGIPVIIGGNGYYDINENGVFDSDEHDYGHVAVAYDYDEENDIIYGNMGWGRSNTHQNIDEYFNLGIMDYYGISISESLDHKHSLKYHSFSSSGYDELICSCKLVSHIHGYTYRSYNDNKHYKKCICMTNNIIEQHLFTSSVYIGIHHYAKCGYCHYLKNIDHDIVPIN